MIRSILAVIAGYLVMAVAIMVLFALWSGDAQTPPTTGFMLFSLAYGFVFAALGGYVAATIAGRAEINHAMALAAFAVAMAIVSMIAAAGRESLWFQLANMVVVVVAVLLGGVVRAGQVAKATGRQA